MAESVTAAKVFDVTELLEATLLELPSKDLLFAQKVCRRWKDVIDASTPIQKALFFKPGVATDAPADAVQITRPFARPRTYWKEVTTDSHLPARDGVAFNSLLCYPDPELRIPEDSKTQERTFEVRKEALDLESAHNGSARSCQRMYLTQPPDKNAVSYIYKNRRFQYREMDASYGEERVGGDRDEVRPLILQRGETFGGMLARIKAYTKERDLKIYYMTTRAYDPSGLPG